MCIYTGRDETEPVYEGALLRRFTALSVVVLFDSGLHTWVMFSLSVTAFYLTVCESHNTPKIYTASLNCSIILVVEGL